MRNRLAFSLIFCVGLCALMPSAMAAELRLAAIYGPNMVLQQQLPARIHGWANPGDEVSVDFAGQHKTAKADDQGAWKLELDAMPASSEARTLKVSSKGNAKTIEVTNVLVGEVWVCSGQSNMAAPMGSLRSIVPADFTEAFPAIRFCTIALVGAYRPKDDVASVQWKPCDNSNMDYFSAVAFYFARDLYRHMKVPIGLIVSTNGGTAVECWLPRAAFDVDAETRGVLAQWEKQLDAVPDSREKYDEYYQKGVQGNLDYYYKTYVPWTKEAEAAKAAGKAPPKLPPNTFDAPPFNFRVPNSLYNGMIHPLTSVTIRGVLWYQGENGSVTFDAFRKMSTSMIIQWRKDWGLGDFPFLIVQLPYYTPLLKDPNGEAPNNSWAPVREAQRKSALGAPNVGLAVTLDTGDDANLHPANKDVVGARLALLARAMAYGEKVVCSGPAPTTAELAGSKVSVSFDQLGGGLMSKGEDGKLSDKAPVKGFALAGADGKYAWAEAVIAGNTVLVNCDKVPKPVSVRYAWASHPPCSLYNREGLPVGPFELKIAPGK